jgi:CheY-like chemotaxis protein
MGGELRVKSEVDRGSLFSFLITLPKAQVPHADRRGLENMSAELLSVLADRRLLVVDGNTCRSETLARRLRAWGCRVLTAQHSRDALELLEAARAADQPVELVLLDLETAGPEGEAQARDMGEKPALGRPRMIALSSTRVQAAARADERLGAVHLGQPARQGALLEAVVRCLEPTRGELLDTGAGPGNRRSQLEALNTQVLLVATGPTESTATVGLTTALGCEVRIATSGAEAVSLYEAQAFDLVLLDLQSPEPAAAELTRELRARESSLSTHVPIIAMTTQGESTDRESCVAAGVSDFLSKPVSSEALRDVIAAWVFEDLSGHRLNDESSPSASDLLGEPGEQLEELATAPEHTPKRRQR